MGLILPDERPDFDLDENGIDEAWMLRAVQTFELRRSKRKFPRLLLRHNGEGFATAPVIGKQITLRWEAPWLRGNALFTNPQAIGMMARGELPSRSAEFVPETAFLWGLSFIQGGEGHFDEELPDFELAEMEGIDELRKLASDSKGKRSLHFVIEKPLVLNDAKMLMEETTEAEANGDGEETTEAESEVEYVPRAEFDDVLRRVANLEAWAQKQQKGDTDPEGDDDVTPEGEKENEMGEKEKKASAESGDVQKLSSENAKLSVKVASLEADKWIAEKTLELVKSGCPLTVEQIGKQLREPKTQEGREERFKALAQGPALPDDDLPTDSSTLGARSRLEAEYNERFGHLPEKKRPVSLEAYLAASERQGVKPR